MYEKLMAEACRKAISNGIEGIAFGDLFLEDVRAYREKQLRGTGLEPIFPLWRQPTDELARTMIRSGLRAKLTCIDTKQLDAEFVGREFDEDLIAALPAGVDPCGERGEFHSFVYAGPMFDLEIRVVVGERVVRDQFVFADLSSAPMPASLSSERL
jgi:diphthamide synthase (EF-2-diphthine--ammonia ligase)